MNITIPDKIYKLTTLISLIIAGYCLYSIQSTYEVYQLKILEATEPTQRNIFIDIYNSHVTRMMTFAMVGISLLFLSFYFWNKDEYKNRIVTKQSEKIYTCCQSCGRNFTSVRPNGTNADESLNLAFCNFCYTDGQFTFPNLTVENLLEEAKTNGYKDKKNTFFFMTLEKKLMNLDRWKKEEY